LELSRIGTDFGGVVHQGVTVLCSAHAQLLLFRGPEKVCHNALRSKMPVQVTHKYLNLNGLVEGLLRRILQMKKLFALLALIAVSGIPALAQGRGEGTSLFEVNGGYTYLRWQVPPAVGPPSSLNYNGFNVGGTINVKNWVGLAADINGTYSSNNGVDTHIYSYLAGPRIYPLGHHKLTPYGHALFGVATIHIPGNLPATEGKFSFAIGGGVDWSLGRHLAFRVGQLDYQRTQFLRYADPSIDNQNNFKFSTGLVFRFGER